MWGGEEALESQQERDMLKDAFCDDNDVKLIRIPYWIEDKKEFIIYSSSDSAYKSSK